MRRAGLAALIGAGLVWAGSAFGAPRAFVLDPPPGMTVERVVMLFRHGVRAPIAGEASLAADQPWPQWTTQAERLTPHGHDAMRLIGRFDRDLFVREGLLESKQCPSADDLSIWTNIAERTIESGQGLAEGLAPDCALSVGHRPLDQTDPLFDPSAIAPFDASAAIASITAATGGLDRLVASRRAAFDVLEAMLGCPNQGPAASCDLAGQASTLAASADEKGLDFTGPIKPAAGTAQVLLLQYAEGLPRAEVGWGRATRAGIAQIASLHALQLEVLYRAPYMARRWAWAMGPKVADVLAGRDAGQSGRIALLVGHDDNIAALTGLLGVHIDLAGYGRDDPPPGSALGFEVLRERRSGRRFVRLFYQSQSLEQLRALAPLSLARPPLIAVLDPACARGRRHLCPLPAAEALLKPQ